MSKFSEWLVAMLDGTGLFTREEWKTVLGLSHVGIIECWVQEFSLPSPSVLRSLLRIVLDTRSEDVLRAFAEIELLPFSEISRFTRAQWCGTSNLAEYLTIPVLEGLRRAMAGLRMEQLEQILDVAAETAHSIDR